MDIRFIYLLTLFILSILVVMISIFDLIVEQENSDTHGLLILVIPYLIANVYCLMKFKTIVQFKYIFPVWVVLLHTLVKWSMYHCSTVLGIEAMPHNIFIISCVIVFNALAFVFMTIISYINPACPLGRCYTTFKESNTISLINIIQLIISLAVFCIVFIR